MKYTFTAYVEWDTETQQYVGVVPGMLGMHTQAMTMDQLHHNLKEVIELCLENTEEVQIPHFVGIQQIEVTIQT